MLWRWKISVCFAARAAIKKTVSNLWRCFETENGNRAQATCWSKFVPEFRPINAQCFWQSWRTLIFRYCAGITLELFCSEPVVILALSARNYLSNRFRRAYVRMLASDDNHAWSWVAICLGATYGRKEKIVAWAISLPTAAWSGAFLFLVF